MTEIIKSVVESTYNEVKSIMAGKQRKVTGDQLDRIKAYDKENRRIVGCRLNKVYDAELIEFWDSLPNKAQWLKQHLRNDLEASKKAGK